jgi:Protein of unknown function (DUF465)
MSAGRFGLTPPTPLARQSFFPKSTAPMTFCDFVACGFHLFGDICKWSEKIGGLGRLSKLRRHRRRLMDEIQSFPLGNELDRLHAEHRRYAQRLEDLLQKPYLTEDEQLEEVRLKKLKLHAKDLIFAIERRQLAVA